MRTIDSFTKWDYQLTALLLFRVAEILMGLPKVANTPHFLLITPHRPALNIFHGGWSVQYFTSLFFSSSPLNQFITHPSSSLHYLPLLLHAFACFAFKVPSHSLSFDGGNGLQSPSRPSYVRAQKEVIDHSLHQMEGMTGTSPAAADTTDNNFHQSPNSQTTVVIRVLPKWSAQQILQMNTPCHGGNVASVTIH